MVYLKMTFLLGIVPLSFIRGFSDEVELGKTILDDLVKSRHPVEKRGPGVCNFLGTLDSGFRRNDGKNAFSTFCEIINIDIWDFIGIWCLEFEISQYLHPPGWYI